MILKEKSRGIISTKPHQHFLHPSDPAKLCLIQRDPGSKKQKLEESTQNHPTYTPS
jgi:hypothetical protein